MHGHVRHTICINLCIKIETSYNKTHVLRCHIVYLQQNSDMTSL